MFACLESDVKFALPWPQTLILPKNAPPATDPADKTRILVACGHKSYSSPT